MTGFTNPALKAFVAELGNEIVIAQVLVQRVAASYELRHGDDRLKAPQNLRTLLVAELRKFAQSTASGAFRPLHAAPNLATGWRCSVADDGVLETALNSLYPGFLADWYAGRAPVPPITHYREFTDRQSGMYRITVLLNDCQAAQVVRACCPAHFCLKRRLWTVPGLEPDPAASKSLIPCLEPCAVLLEFARKARRLEQEAKVSLEISAADLAVLRGALNTALQNPPADLREADFGHPANPRRLQLLSEKLRTLIPTKDQKGRFESEDDSELDASPPPL
jgi:hypothetical protein